MVAAGDAKREEHEEIFSLCFFPPRLNSTVRGGAREGIKAGGAERAGPKRRRVRVGGGRGCLRGCWLAAAGMQSRRVRGQGRRRWKTNLTNEAHLASEMSCRTHLSEREKRGAGQGQ